MDKERAWDDWKNSIPEGGEIPYSYALQGLERPAFNAGWDAAKKIDEVGMIMKIAEAMFDCSLPIERTPTWKERIELARVAVKAIIEDD